MVDAAQAPRIAVAINAAAPRDLESQPPTRVFKSGADAIVCASMAGSDGKNSGGLYHLRFVVPENEPEGRSFEERPSGDPDGLAIAGL
jgi:hypothetical protein